MLKSGFVSIIGRPNVGKSTLLNGFVGEQIAIATPKPQTTRNRIMGIKNAEEGQAVFLDTPGIHRASTLLNRSMVNTALGAFSGADLLLFLLDAGAGFRDHDQFIVNSFKGLKMPVILVINKIDLIAKEDLLPLMDQCSQMFAFAEIIPLSALDGRDVAFLLEKIWKYLPEGPPCFQEDMITDRSERFIASEIIREKIILATRQEIPYVSAVVIDSFKEDEAKNLLRIAGVIYVERESQKGIMIGKKGATLKRIGTQARLSLEAFFSCRVFLELFVRVRKDWTKDPRMLKEFGYGES